MPNAQKIHDLLRPVRLPQIACVRQSFDRSSLDSPVEELTRQLRGTVCIRPGQRIAITAGSRGIDRYAQLLRAMADFIREQGGYPFLVPSMGSHGGGTAQGQQSLLERLGVTEQRVGAPIRASMEVTAVGVTPRGLPVYLDKLACEADGIIVFNRIKPHPSFQGKYESGLAKMLAIGLAKHKGAAMTHCLRFENMAENVEQAARVAVEQAPVLCGVATLENAYGSIAELHVLRREEILEREPELLGRASQLMPRICLDEIDVLIVCEIGKDITGSGVDPNITGKHVTTLKDTGPKTTAMGVLRLTKATGKNPHGMGLADYMSRRIYDAMDVTDSYINSLTSLATLPAKIPITLDTDELVCKACAKASGVPDWRELKMVIVRDTKHLDTVYMSPAACREAMATGQAEPEGDFFDLPFGGDGALKLFVEQ